MRGVRRVCRLTPLLVFLGVALTCGLPSGQAQDGKQAAFPDGLSEVSPALPMPAFSLPGLNGDVFNSAALQGKVAVVRFWATW